MKAPSLTMPVRSAALALTLFGGMLTASALQTATPANEPGNTPAAPAKTRPGYATWTPAARVSSKVPAYSGEDIRDIRQPRHLPTPLPWAAAVAGVLLLCAAAFAAWRRMRRQKVLQMLPHEIAIQHLEESRRLMDPEHAREYCFAVSKTIRCYIEKRFYVEGLTLTTEEFLRHLVEVRDTMLESHRALLGEFLQHCDLAKFAAWRYSMPDLQAMHVTALSFVQQTAVVAAPGNAKGGRLASGATAVQPQSDANLLAPMHAVPVTK